MSNRNPNVFQQDRVPGMPGRWALGLWLPSRKLASSAWVPGQKFRMGLVGRQPYFFYLGFPNPNFAAMAPQSNADDNVTSINDFIVLAILASAVDSAGAVNQDFSAQIFESSNQLDSLWTQAQANAGSLGGSGQNPFVLRRPHYVRAGTQLICRINNFHAVNSNNPQITLFGVLGAPGPGF
jgi:hypothetical protein